MPHFCSESGADGIGLFRTELQFMIGETMPRLADQTHFYNSIFDAAGDRPVVFRTLDLGGDKVLPYARWEREENFGAGLARHPHRARSSLPCCATRCVALLA